MLQGDGLGCGGGELYLHADVTGPFYSSLPSPTSLSSPEGSVLATLARGLAFAVEQMTP